MMISPKAQYNLKNAKAYFREHLQVGDYYAQENTVHGEWFGQGADSLGLKGAVTEEAFLALCEGNNPATGERLTLRKNTTRFTGGKETANRRIFYDFTISPPKSVSILGLYQDERIAILHDKSIQKAVRELERFAMTRVRKKGRSDDRETGNVIGASFRHETSRALDPHLHTHCIVMNATFDPVENRWKALQNYEMLKAQKFVENFYYHELAKGLQNLGYSIANNARDFEVAGVSQELVEKFSKRHEQIDEAVRQHLSEGKFVGNIKELRAQIAHEKRARKMQDSTATKLREHWDSQLTDAERSSLARKVQPESGANSGENLDAIVAWADAHLFERKSVIEDYQLKAAALSRGRGEAFTLDDLNAAVDRRGYLRNSFNNKITSRETLGRELEIVRIAKDGKFRHQPFAKGYISSISTLSDEQKSAIERILGSRNYVTLFRGGAGTGKSFTLQEVDKGLQASGYHTVVLAPQRQQVIDLQADGFEAQTVARFLAKKELPEKAVVIIDEAGQIGGKQMFELFRTLKSKDTRIILSGDTRQHGAVEASDALRAIERHARLPAIELTAIRRQDPERGESEKERQQIGDYRDAVKAAAAGDIVQSFEQLEALDCIEQIDEAERKDVLAENYLEARQAGEKTLIVAQTWEEIHGVNTAVRGQLKKAGLLGEDKELAFFESRDLDEAQKRDTRFYQDGDSVYFIRKYGRFEKGAFARIERANDSGLSLRRDGKVTRIALKQSNRFVVVRERKLRLASGDRLQMKFNGKSVEGESIVNGELVTVRRILKDGRIAVLDDRGQRKTLAPEQRLANLGYAVTSYASQGKTVDTVLFSDAHSRAATNRNQWYVSISRARKRIKVFTSDKEALRSHVQSPGERMLAMELTGHVPKGSARRPASRVAALREHALRAAKDLMLKSIFNQSRLRRGLRRHLNPRQRII